MLTVGMAVLGAFGCVYCRALQKDIDCIHLDMEGCLGSNHVEGDFGCMVGTRNQEIIRVPLSEVAGKLKYVDPKASIIDEAKTIGISFGDE